MAEVLGIFEQVVLLAVLGLEEDAYGRAVLREAQKGGDGERSVSAGAVYATLDRLEQKGLLASRLEAGGDERGGRMKRFYRLTGGGVAALEDTHRALEQMWRGKERLLKRWGRVHGATFSGAGID